MSELPVTARPRPRAFWADVRFLLGIALVGIFGKGLNLGVEFTENHRLVRGLDYYTGTVYETVLVGHEQLGSICSGGRYDALASKGNRVFPGVGLSIGVTRLVMRMLSQQMAVASRSVPTAVYVALTADEDWSEAQDVAALLRQRGIPAEVAVSAEKFGKQIKYADRRGIPFVWFMGRDDAGARVHEVKDIRSGEQHAADPADWTPPAEDLWPTVRTVTAGR